jgi:3-methyl-2-oxobutanoate hydroxymethyltransferase
MKETGAQAVKLETSVELAGIVQFLVKRGIPVMGHIGLRPQAVLAEGGFKAKGRTNAERDRIMNEARDSARAGAFAVVVEGVAEGLAHDITAELEVPTIGIGASAGCDGQILVTDDMLGLFDWTPKFVRRYADLRGEIGKAVGAYADDVRNRRFPGPAEIYYARAG